MIPSIIVAFASLLIPAALMEKERTTFQKIFIFLLGIILAIGSALLTLLIISYFYSDFQVDWQETYKGYATMLAGHLIALFKIVFMKKKAQNCNTIEN